MKKIDPKVVQHFIQLIERREKLIISELNAIEALKKRHSDKRNAIENEIVSLQAIINPNSLSCRQLVYAYLERNKGFGSVENIAKDIERDKSSIYTIVNQSDVLEVKHGVLRYKTFFTSENVKKPRCPTNNKKK